MDTTGIKDAPQKVQEFVTRWVGNRRDGKAKVIKSPEGTTVVRVSWTECQTAGGPYGGWSRDVEVVHWATWLGEAGEFYVGRSDTRKAALEEAQYYRDLRQGVLDELAEEGK